MRVLLIHEFFLRPDEGGGARFNVTAKRWAERGAEVTVLARQSHYATGRRRGTGLLEREQVDGIEVVRPWTPAYDKRRKGARMAAMGAFAISATAALETLGPHDICVASSPTLAAWAVGLAASTKMPLVAEIRDLWPESAITTGILDAKSIAAKSAEAVEVTTCETADHIVALTPGIARRIVDRGLVSRRDVSVFPNGALERPKLSTLERARARRELGWGDDFVVIYAGAHGIANDLGQLAAATRNLRPGARVVMMGDGPLKARWRRRFPEVEWRGPVDHDRLWSILGAADTGAVVLQDNPTFRTVYPNKLFDYMSVGLPVICGVLGDAEALVRSAGAGTIVAPGDPQKWWRAIEEMRALDPSERARMGDRGRSYVLEQFDRIAIADRYLELLHRLKS